MQDEFWPPEPVWSQNVLEIEEWKLFDEFPRYDVSNQSRVCNRKTGRILKPATTQNGYQIIVLHKNGKGHSLYVHIVVAKVWLSPPLFVELNIVNHLDSNRTNNRASNLEWTNRSGNAKHSVEARKRARIGAAL